MKRSSHSCLITEGTPTSGRLAPPTARCGAVTRETDPRVVVAVPVWSPQGDWINFLSNRNSNNSDVTLWLTRPDGSDDARSRRHRRVGLLVH